MVIEQITIMDVFNLNSMINHRLRKTILSGVNLLSISYNIIAIKSNLFY